MKDYGMEVIVDLHGCDVSRFTRKDIRRFMDELCELIDMEPRDLIFWDWSDWKSRLMLRLGLWKKTPKTSGISAVQFITESNITTHTLDELGDVYLNVFSCKEFSGVVAAGFARDFFRAKHSDFTELKRGFQ